MKESSEKKIEKLATKSEEMSPEEIDKGLSEVPDFRRAALNVLDGCKELPKKILEQWAESGKSLDNTYLKDIEILEQRLNSEKNLTREDEKWYLNEIGKIIEKKEKMYREDRKSRIECFKYVINRIFYGFLFVITLGFITKIIHRDNDDDNVL